MTERTQAILVWWGLGFMYLYGLCLYGLLNMMPPPAATLDAAAVAAFYTEHSFDIRLGSIITSWVSAFMVPIAVTIGIQIARLEKMNGKKWPVWATLQVAGGIMMSIFLVLPPIFWGVAAYTPTRPAEVTLLMHELGTLTLVTTDQYFIFQMVAIAVVSLSLKGEHSPFPRWYGYFTIWAAFMFELGAIAFAPKTGPFSWNGLLVFWSPLTIFGTWVTTTAVLLLKALKKQAASGT